MASVPRSRRELPHYTDLSTLEFVEDHGYLLVHTEEGLDPHLEVEEEEILENAPDFIFEVVPGVHIPTNQPVMIIVRNPAEALVYLHPNFKDYVTD